MTAQKVKPVCILGCGRSGTSIFGELFQSLPHYQYYSEPDWADFICLDFSSPIAVKVPRPAKNKLTPGLPFLIEEFEQIFPTAGTIFWQVRHPLDTICSLKVGISKNWGHHPRPPDYKKWQLKPLVVQCAYHWNYINTVGFRALKHQLVINRFEDMLKNPFENALRNIKLVDITYMDHLSNLRKWSERVQDSNNDKFIEADCSKPYSLKDHTRRIGRWKENLNRKELDLVLPIIKEGSELFGYELDIT